MLLMEFLLEEGVTTQRDAKKFLQLLIRVEGEYLQTKAQQDKEEECLTL